ncbi:MAG: hypothetical protein JNM56_09655 [Planctomycetia bacterium]|nr:hypothetical protein [Planctomycetia bacterium]
MVNIVADCTVSEKILLAAFDLEEEGQSPFSAEALIVKSWQKFPKAFGLKGYADQYPDSNKVLTSIMGEKGLTRRGWLSKMGQKLYTLTREGRQMVRKLGHEEVAAAAPVERANKPSRDQEKFLLGLLGSPAVEKYQQGLKLELTFADACKFWGISENLRGEALDARMDRLRAGLTEMDRLVGSGGGVDLSNGRNIGKDEMKQIHKVDEYLSERFGRHLSLLRNRGERN